MLGDTDQLDSVNQVSVFWNENIAGLWHLDSFLAKSVQKMHKYQKIMKILLGLIKTEKFAQQQPWVSFILMFLLQDWSCCQVFNIFFLEGGGLKLYSFLCPQVAIDVWNWICCPYFVSFAKQLWWPCHLLDNFLSLGTCSLQMVCENSHWVCNKIIYAPQASLVRLSVQYDTLQ